MSDMHDLNDMYVFAQVVEHGGFSPASRALSLTTSKLSRRVSDLDASLGVHLLNRTTRKMSLSEAGETFYRHCMAVVDEVQAARDAMAGTRSTPQGLLRIG
jgi:DNA-binding transcriptional LysR family regulator